MTRKVGIMGGTFDPVHLGHLVCAQMASDACGLDEVRFVVAGNPHFKQDQQVSPADARLQMVSLAVLENEQFSVSDMETKRPGVTFTADTLSQMHDAAPDEELFFIMGTDSLITLPCWKRAEDIARLARIVCVSRPGYVVDGTLMEQLAAMGFSVQMVPAPEVALSSHVVRSRIRQGESVRYLVPDSVIAYIKDVGLYQEVDA